MARRFVTDEGGFVNGPEWAFVVTILMLGAITGALVMRDAPEVEPEPPAPLVQTR